MSKKDDSSIKYIGLGAAVLVGGFAIGALGVTLFDNIRDSQPSSNGLQLVSYNAHLKEGIHRIVLTNSFYDLYTDGRSTKWQNYAINCVKKAYTDLNKYNSGIKFDIYTQNDGLLKYGFKKAETIDYMHDIPLNLTTDPLKSDDGKRSAIAITDYQINDTTRELHNQSITVYKPYVYAIFKSTGKWEDDFVPSNSYFYATLVHETMHAIGFAHQNSKDTVMYPYSGINTAHELTDKDIEMLKTYNTTFYSETKYETPVFTETPIEETPIEETEMEM